METFENPSALSDYDLFEKCRTYGMNAKMFLRRFYLLLPEVEKRELWKTYKFYDIYDFAARLAGMSHDAVDDSLRVIKKLHDMELLKSKLEKHGIHKLRIVANIATKENEAMLADKVEHMSKQTLETFVRELRNQESCRSGTESGIPTLFDDGVTLEPPTPTGEHLFIRLSLEPATELRLRELQRKLSKEQKSPATFNDVVKFLLEQYESARITRKKKIATDEELQKIKAQTCADRYIPTSVRNLITQKHHGRCAFPNCHKLSDIFHHTRRFFLIPNHNPDFLVPLCTNHEQLAHLGLIENEEKSPDEWKLRIEPDQTLEKFAVDRTVNQYRMAK